MFLKRTNEVKTSEVKCCLLKEKSVVNEEKKTTKNSKTKDFASSFVHSASEIV